MKTTEPETQTNGTSDTHKMPPPAPERGVSDASSAKAKRAAKPKKERAVKAKSKTAKKTKAKKSAKVAKKASSASTQAQSGPAIELVIEKMNKDEIKILKAVFTKSGERKPKTIKELQAALTGGNAEKIKETSDARNALRRLVRGGWVEKAERGTYRLTEKGRKRGFKEA